MSTRRMQNPLTILALIAVLAWSGAVASAAEESTLDPVVADVVEMLRAGVDEGVIIQWLESTGRRPTDIGKQGLIALTEADASERLITILLQRVDRLPEQESPTAPAPSPVAKPDSKPAGASLEPEGGERDGGSVETTLQLRAKRVWTEEEEPDSPREPDWWVFLYLDGEFIGWTAPSLKGEPVEARRIVGTGRHEVRVVLQRYQELRGGWLHESLAVPTLIEFEATPGDAVEIDVEMKRIWGLWRQRRDGGPLRYLIRQGEQILAEHDGTGGDPNRWSPVCEDVEANFPDVDSVPRRFRNAMSRCVRWADLWTGAGRETSRAQILALLAQDDFAPPMR